MCKRVAYRSISLPIPRPDSVIQLFECKLGDWQYCNGLMLHFDISIVQLVLVFLSESTLKK